MEPPSGFLATLWNFICFLPYFIGLLLLGTVKGLSFILGIWFLSCTNWCSFFNSKLVLWFYGFGFSFNANLMGKQGLCVCIWCSLNL